MNNPIHFPKPSPLPATLSAVHDARRAWFTHNDWVREIYDKLWEDPEHGKEFRELLDAVYKWDTVEGSFGADDLLAAIMIRNYAKQHDVPIVQDMKLMSIKTSLNYVMRKSGHSRKQRRDMVMSELHR